jgi:hypothetical protein
MHAWIVVTGYITYRRKGLCTHLRAKGTTFVYFNIAKGTTSLKDIRTVHSVVYSGCMRCSGVIRR